MISTPKRSDEEKLERRRRLDRDRKRKKYASDPEFRKRHAEKQRVVKYGLTPEAFANMFDAQGRVCAVCKTDTPPTVKGWAVDHCHTSGAVRGILCAHCNTALGLFKDSPQTLFNAIQYLN